MLILELNEFNLPLLKRLAESGNYVNLKRLLSFNHIGTTTGDKPDSGYLEPWVQWVSLHTGTESSVHQIKNLGDVPNLMVKQLWESWSERGHSSIIWGVMNGTRGSASLCDVFIPDPWTFTEEAYPTDFGCLLSLPRYLATNYLDVSIIQVMRKSIDLFSGLFKVIGWRESCRSLSLLVRLLFRLRFKNIAFILFYEYASALCFVRSVRSRSPEYSILFLNSLAHAQHHYWADSSGDKSDELKITASVIDKILEKIFEAQAEIECFEDVLVINGLSQRCTVDEEPWYLYRPKNHELMIHQLGLSPEKVEPLMTYDAHLFFFNASQCEHAMKVLTSATVGGQPLFFVEKDNQNDKKLFYRVDFSAFAHGAEMIKAEGYVGRFFDHFELIVRRTGTHIPTGDVLTNCRDSQQVIKIENVVAQLRI